MNISCVACRAGLRVDDSLAGKRGKCPKCGVVMDIPPLVPLGVPPPLPPPITARANVPTERQKEYASSLGIEVTAGMTKGKLSRAIREAEERRDSDRCARLEDLSNRESAAYEAMRNEILAEMDEEDCRLSKATPEQMLEELTSRGRWTILISFSSDEADFDDLTGTEFDISCSDGMSNAQWRTVLIGLGAIVAKQGIGS